MQQRAFNLLLLIVNNQGRTDPLSLPLLSPPSTFFSHRLCQSMLLRLQHRRHHQRLPHSRPRDAVQFVFMLKVIQVLYHVDIVPVADA